MNIQKQIYEDKALLRLSGRLDSNTAPILESELSTFIDDINELIFDFGELDYISSAGLRIMLVAQKRMLAVNGYMYLENTNEVINEVFEMTGFSSILTINTGYLEKNQYFVT